MCLRCGHVPFKFSSWATQARYQQVKAHCSPLYGIMLTSSGWCDYLVGCETSCPPSMSVMDLWRRGRRGEQDQARVAFDFDADPESSSEDWI